MFQLTSEEKREVVTNCDHLRKLKFSPSLPYAFTEHGAIMLASVLNSPRAIEASIYVVRAFVRLRGLLESHKELAHKLTDLEQKISKHDAEIQTIFKVIRQLMQPPEPPTEPPKRRIGFRVEEQKAHYSIRRRR
jgi:hypothetical protein